MGGGTMLVGASPVGRVTIERPAGRVPVTLLIDDPCPHINPLHAFRTQVLGEPPDGLAETIPNAFLEEFARWVERAPVRGKFSVLPYPAGLGPITTGWEGYGRDELAEWLAIVRERIMPRFDVTPEVLTH